MTDVYDETLQLTLQRDLERFEKAGMAQEAEKVKARLADLGDDKPEADLADLTKAELLALAEERGVEVSSSATKAEIAEALEEG